jgi:hypothetical protein
MHAQCQCGQLSAAISGTTEQIVACHCTDCQRRSGSPFGVVAYFPEAIVEITGTSSEYTRTTDVGNRFTTGFCPQCGTSVWCKGDAKTGVTGITVGSIANPDFPAPVRSVWEQSMHSWVVLPENIAHFPRGRT